MLKDRAACFGLGKSKAFTGKVGFDELRCGIVEPMPSSLGVDVLTGTPKAEDVGSRCPRMWHRSFAERAERFSAACGRDTKVSKQVGLPVTTCGNTPEMLGKCIDPVHTIPALKFVTSRMHISGACLSVPFLEETMKQGHVSVK